MPHVNVLESGLAVLVVVDIQEKLLPAIASSPPDSIIDAAGRLIQAARILDIPILHTEQYPKGLGPTDSRIKGFMAAESKPIEKTQCSCWRDAAFREALESTHREQVILVGVETHVCIQQTAMDLIRVDYVPFVAADAVGSRRPGDATMALDRMRRAGAEISTAESLIFELIERCDHPRFKAVLELIK